MVCIDCAIRAFDGKPWQVVEHRLLEIDFSFLAHLQQHEGDEGLRDGPDVKHLRWVEALLAFEFVEAVGRDTHGTVLISSAERDSRGVHGMEIIGDEGVENGVGGVAVLIDCGCSVEIDDGKFGCCQAEYSGTACGEETTSRDRPHASPLILTAGL